MSTIIAALPECLVLVIRDYVLDIDTRISVLHLHLQERFDTATSDEALILLLRTFKTKQLKVIGDWMTQFYQGGDLIQDGTRQIRLPSLVYKRGHETRTWGRPTPYNTTTETQLHPVQKNVHYYISECKTKGKTGLISALNRAFCFLRFTCIYDTVIDRAFRNQAYRMLSGTILYERTVTPVKKARKNSRV
jgi:hypothetical protein